MARPNSSDYIVPRSECFHVPALDFVVWCQENHGKVDSPNQIGQVLDGGLRWIEYAICPDFHYDRIIIEGGLDFTRNSDRFS